MQNVVTLEQVLCVRNEIINYTYMMAVKCIDQFGSIKINLDVFLLFSSFQFGDIFYSLIFSENYH